MVSPHARLRGHSRGDVFSWASARPMNNYCVIARCAIVLGIIDPALQGCAGPGAYTPAQMQRGRKSACCDPPIQGRSSQCGNAQHISNAKKRGGGYGVFAAVDDGAGSHRGTVRWPRCEGLQLSSGRPPPRARTIEHGSASSSERHTCIARQFGRESAVASLSSSVTSSRPIQSRTSDRRQPMARPRKFSLFGKRPTKHRPAISQRGRRVRRATSCDLNSSSSGGKRSLTQGEITTRFSLFARPYGLPAAEVGFTHGDESSSYT